LLLSIKTKTKLFVFLLLFGFSAALILNCAACT
jgi:hypothetical protein